jgi:GntR family transcriptional regulator
MFGHYVKACYTGGEKNLTKSPAMTETRYAQVARDLAEGIATGRYPIGSLLPTEFELCDRYRVSRHTMRAAIRELQELGLVSRRKKVGTRVEAASPSSGYRQSLASIEDLIQFGAAHRRVVREIEDIVADRALAKELGCPPGTRWLRISSLRMKGEGDAAPIGWTDVYVNAAYSGLREIVRDSPAVLISTLIESHYGRRIAEIRQDIQATLVAAKLAAELGMEAGSPVLRIIRHYVDAAGHAFEISITIHPADRFTFSILLRRERDRNWASAEALHLARHHPPAE